MDAAIYYLASTHPSLLGNGDSDGATVSAETLCENDELVSEDEEAEIQLLEAVCEVLIRTRALDFHMESHLEAM
ncbi:hypothetical protein AGABI2DRAFT_119209 [Agaricus bisporus var. bisporus H97]|uniref:hypothetical protein n=1 Tax=Agaricus bisporus var. bisporus (strain H97 / ATCC MYA-4626 / FGSC 10389) TaxID=936046 RepID=UPI00029F6532|nr:hypothetical protein AGABI2DRAFT_119209 [Agaricus bisporus var. bisporus H97]EKV45523.1 hypothetical protein AGABI2DRAFT_119209 [Agaricus bisporus var. bisporus H97]